MRTIALLLPTIALSSPALAYEPTIQGDRVISLESAMTEAAERAVRVLAADADVDAARARSAVVVTSVLPTFRADAGLSLWDRPAAFDLVEGRRQDCASALPSLDALCSSLYEPVPARDQLTWSATVRAIQPITGIAAGVEAAKAAHASTEAARSDLASAQRAARFDAADTWYGALEAEARVEVAEAQVRSLSERERSVAASVEAKAAVKNDLLQVRLALAQARQAALGVEALRDTAYRRLSIAIGGDGSPVRPDGVVAEPSGEALPGEEALLSAALDAREDLRALRTRVDAARASVRATSWQRVPSISAVAGVTHQEGQHLGTPNNMGFVGVQADWTVWAWDRAGAETRAERAAADRMAAELQGAEAAVRLEVASRRTSVDTARASWEVSRDSVSHAEENLALFRIRYDSGAATTLELLDAESQLVHARSSELTARYGLLRAEAALALATGG